MIDVSMESAERCMECKFNSSILEDLNAKYVTLISDLKCIFKKEEECYPVPDIITGLCTADKGNLTFFAKEDSLRLAKSIDQLFFYIARECKYFDFAILKTFINGSKCLDAKKLMDSYIKEVENSIIVGLNLKVECEKVQNESYENSTKVLKIVCEKDKLQIKELNLIVETVQTCLKLPKASILVKDAKLNCVILICRIPLEVKLYLLQLRIFINELKPLSTLKIKSLIIDEEMELQIPVDCDSKVCTYVSMHT